VRQAIALTMDRQKMIDKALSGHGTLANDHVIFSLYPYFNADAVVQRTQDIAMAKQLLKDAGAEGLSVDLDYIKGQEMPNLAVLVADGMKQAGIAVKLRGSGYDTFYGKYWCPDYDGCPKASTIGIVDYGHRGSPDVYLNAALSSKGVWNSSNYHNPEFDKAFADWAAAVDIDAQTTTAGVIQKNLTDNTPVGIPYTINTLAAFNTKFQGVVNTAMGFTFLEGVSQV